MYQLNSYRLYSDTLESNTLDSTLKAMYQAHPPPPGRCWWTPEILTMDKGALELAMYFRTHTLCTNWSLTHNTYSHRHTKPEQTALWHTRHWTLPDNQCTRPTHHPLAGDDGLDTNDTDILELDTNQTHYTFIGWFLNFDFYIVV